VNQADLRSCLNRTTGFLRVAGCELRVACYGLRVAEEMNIEHRTSNIEHRMKNQKGTNHWNSELRVRFFNQQS